MADFELGEALADVAGKAFVGDEADGFAGVALDDVGDVLERPLFLAGAGEVDLAVVGADVLDDVDVLGHAQRGLDFDPAALGEEGSGFFEGERGVGQDQQRVLEGLKGQVAAQGEQDPRLLAEGVALESQASVVELALAVLLAFVPFLGFASTAFDFSPLEKSVVETTLANGLKLIIMPRHDAPVISFVTWADVGGSDDPKEYTGLAHMFEHMAFKGTETIGTKDSAKEFLKMAKEDAIFKQIRAERLKGRLTNEKLIASLTVEFEKAIAEAYELVVPNEFANRLQKEGGSELNAWTSRAQTAYVVSLPSNKIEFWMAMESERFLKPRLREMYRERQVVAEERRMTVENRPIGKLVEAMEEIDSLTADWLGDEPEW